MDDRAFNGATSQKTLALVAQQSIKAFEALFQRIIINCQLPEEGLSDLQIRHLLERLALMDANNSTSCGVGEREGRIYSTLVRERHFGLAHGIGRSGTLTELQPKAAGSALLQQCTTNLTKQMLQVAGLHFRGGWRCLLVPMATGMTLALALRALGRGRPHARIVLELRIDQKSCIKCVEVAGLQLVIVPLKVVGEQLETDLDALLQCIAISGGADAIVAIMTTVSCFAPRACDDVVGVGKICAEMGIPHLVNCAYGLQSSIAMGRLNNCPRVDAIVGSLDKNFMVPVGGAWLVAPKVISESVAALYAGRASSSSIIDLFITVLAMGKAGYRKLLEQRRECFRYFKEAIKQDFTLLETPGNDISMAIKVPSGHESWQSIGSKLFLRGVSGAKEIRLSGPVPRTTTINSIEFCNFGSHHDAYPHDYLTIASAIGQSKDEIDKFIRKLSKLVKF